MKFENAQTLENEFSSILNSSKRRPKKKNHIVEQNFIYFFPKLLES